VIDDAINELTSVVGVRAACAAVGEPRARHYRRHRKSPVPPRPEREATPQPRALTEVERKEIRRVLNSPEHVDEAPATVYAKLLDQGIYLGSVPTMYRILREHDEVGDRRRHATHPARVKPELVATRPNQVYSWDITKLHGPAKWTYYYLYSIIDIYSRFDEPGHPRLDRTVRDLAPEARQLPRHQIVPPGLQEPVDHQKRDERADLRAGRQTPLQRLRRPHLRVGPAVQERPCRAGIAIVATPGRGQMRHVRAKEVPAGMSRSGSVDERGPHRTPSSHEPGPDGRSAVVSTCACPNSACITAKSTPASARAVPKLCRRACGWPPTTPVNWR
jgi:hypothetical protein